MTSNIAPHLVPTSLYDPHRSLSVLHCLQPPACENSPTKVAAEKERIQTEAGDDNTKQNLSYSNPFFKVAPFLFSTWYVVLM